MLPAVIQAFAPVRFAAFNEPPALATAGSFWLDVVSTLDSQVVGRKAQWTGS
jgi:hypothetical protein